jgi:hypothetical protein
MNQLRPLDARFDFHLASLKIKSQDAIHPRHIQQDGVCAELLPAHRVSSARD